MKVLATFCSITTVFTASFWLLYTRVVKTKSLFKAEQSVCLNAHTYSSFLFYFPLLFQQDNIVIMPFPWLMKTYSTFHCYSIRNMTSPKTCLRTCKMQVVFEPLHMSDLFCIFFLYDRITWSLPVSAGSRKSVKAQWHASGQAAICLSPQLNVFWPAQERARNTPREANYIPPVSSTHVKRSASRQRAADPLWRDTDS